MENKEYILISAATSDIGKAIVKKLSNDYNIVLHGRNQNKLDEVVSNISSCNEIKTWCFDFIEIENIHNSLKAFMLDNQILISGFIHCAGILKILPIKNFNLNYSKEIFDVNFFSAVEIVRTLLLKINKSTLSNIVFISALYSKFGNKGNTMYASSKGALDSLVKSLALELAPDVRVNSILPGGLETMMTRQFFMNEENVLKYNQEYPLGKGDCDDIANMADFLLSVKSKWITGQNIFVDGGRSCI